MTKESKNRDLLRRLLKGEKPTLTVSVIECSDSMTLVTADKVLKELTRDEVPAYLEKIRQDNPLREVVLILVDREEYEAICARLEEEY